ncbi:MULTISPECIES: ABC transporter ATP-binding protein [unclassified Brevibacterium]|uniref:ABC transporter ATP-binding protein n=1 Tax=unclassified Brevibacterium TaxID=2614124 RepID=UPI0008A4CBA0|nr:MULTISPECIES: ABC transporter ATP-binding protein [unclassified Brevibacterium]OFL64144.1 multidrug ABC transporter ATP-binding protein [Brevibacterium sp. HMSC063G07]
MLLHLFRKFALPLWPALLGLLVFEALQIAGSLALPTLNARVIDDGIAVGDAAVVWRLGAAMLALTFGQLVTNILAVACGAYASLKAAQHMRTAFFAKVSSFGFQEIAQFGTSSLVTRSTNDVRQVQQFLTMAMSIAIMAPFMAVGGLIMALTLDLALSWTIVATVVLLMAIMVWAIRGMVPSFRIMQERLDAMGSVLSQQLSGLRVIRAFVKEDAEKKRYERVNDQMTDAYMTVGKYFVTLFPLVMLVVGLGEMAIVWFGALGVEAGTSNVGSIMAFTQYLMLILMGVLMASFLAMMMPRAEVAAGRIREVLETEPAQTRSGSAESVSHPGLLEVSDVTFCFPGAEAPVLDSVTFTCRPGTTTAIIGATGSGKTVLMQLIVGLLDPTSGSVVIGGVPAEELTAEARSEQFGYVPQKPQVFGDTIEGNLRKGNPGATDAQVQSALRTSQAWEYVQGLEGQTQYRVNQNGTNLSGGQRQRLAIAMALVRPSPILIFDDSFSALDTQTEARVRDGIAQMGPRTQIVVTQRCSSAARADQIVVLDEGRAVAVGTHTELLESSDVYREIYSSQTGAAHE